MSEISLPIEHLSYSSMRKFCNNPQMFFKNYILGIWDIKQSMVMLVGSAFHKTMEHYYKTGDLDSAITIGTAYISTIKEEDVQWGKTGTREAAQKRLAAAVNFYMNEQPEVGKVIGVEEVVTTDRGFGGQPLPVPVKAVTDLVTEKDGKLHLWDYKVVSSFTDTETEDPLKIIQAMFNYVTQTAKHGKEPEDFTYLEIKATKNKDGSPQVQPYRIVYSEHEAYKTYFLKLYTDVIVELAREDRRWLPNFGDMLTGAESWEDYISDTIDFKTLPNVSHRTNLKQVEVKGYVASDIETDETLTKEQKIKAKLQEFAMPVEMRKTYTGHNVILYTMTPARGIRMTNFDKHVKDIKLALEAKSVRIQAPIPGTGLVGIEVNRDQQGVLPWTDDLLDKGQLTIPAGVDVYGKPHKISLSEAPHILIGGTTGSGKSVFMNTIIKALTKQMDPDDLKMILIDPKRTEFIEHENLPHLEVSIITEVNKASLALEWCVTEMENRYQRLEQARVKNIQNYRKSYRDMPYIAVIIDELADIMLSNEQRVIEEVTIKDNKPSRTQVKKQESDIVKDSIIKLAQKARAVGIHLIVATQRPSVDIIPGIMKANFPTQVAFMVNKKVDSTVILDQPGAEELIGKGDMLFASPGTQGLTRLQAYYTE